MFCVHTQKVRHLVGSFTRGMELPAAFSRLFTDHGIRSGHVDLAGQLEGFSLLTEPRGVPLVVNAPALILRCAGFVADVDGKVSTHLMATLQVPGPAGPQIVGGLLVFARILSCEFRLDAFDDVFIVKRSDPKLLFPTWADCFTETAGAPDRQGPVSLDAAPAEPETESPILVSGIEDASGGSSGTDGFALPGAGDIVEHFKFGSCRVQKVDSGDMLEVWLPSKNKARLSMQVLTFDLVGEDPDGTRRFLARPIKHR